MGKRDCEKHSRRREQAPEGATRIAGDTGSMTPEMVSCGTPGREMPCTREPIDAALAANSVSVDHTTTDQEQPSCKLHSQILSTVDVNDKNASSVSKSTVIETPAANAFEGKEKSGKPCDSSHSEARNDSEEQWILGSISASIFESSEPLGLITAISALGSWVSAAFATHEKDLEGELVKTDKRQEEEEEANRAKAKGKEKNETENDSEPSGNLQGGKFGASAPENLPCAKVESRQSDAQPKQARVVLSSEFQQGSLDQLAALPSPQASPNVSHLPHGDDSHLDLQVFLHLCGQPHPIRWSPGDAIPKQSTGLRLMDAAENGVLQAPDSNHLQVPAPELLTETESHLQSPTERLSLRQFAENIEMWFLDIGSKGLIAQKEDSASSSDSFEETTGAPLTGIEGDFTFPAGGDGNHQTCPDDGLCWLNSTLPMFQRELGCRNPLEGFSRASRVPVDAVEGDDTGLQSAMPRHGAEDTPTALQGTHCRTLLQQDTQNGSSHQLTIGRGEDSTIDELHPQGAHGSHHYASKDENSGTGAADSVLLLDDLYIRLDRSALRDFVEGTETLRANPSAKATFVQEQQLACGATENADRTMLGDVSSCELSTEEAATKEASLRSWGNRIWAFFGGETGAERTQADGDAKMDVVEQTLPFEDPAVVQRDDHRAFSSETSLLLESIKQEHTLQLLSPQQQRYVASLMRRDIFPASTCIVEEGAEPVLMWCSAGEFEVSQAGFFGVSVLRSLTPGEFFGLEELVSGEKLKCTLTSRQSASECALWVLDRDIFNDSVKDMLAKRKAFVPVAQDFLHMVCLVRDLPEEEIYAVARACKVERFAEGQTVFKMGFHGDMFCFIYKGEAITQKPQDGGGFLELARQGKGEYFGEMALIKSTRRTASVVAGTELVLFCLDKESFETLLSPLKEKMAAKAASTYKRQDEAPLTASEMKSADGSALAPVLATRDAGEVCAKKRTRKNSLALLNYSKIRDQEKQSENGESDTPEDRSTARWRLAREPESIHEPPPLCTQGGRSCLKENNPQGVHRKPKSPVRFDEGSLLPSESSSDEG